MEIVKCQNCGSTETINYSDGTLRCKYCGTIVRKTSMNSFDSMALRSANRVGNIISSGSKNKIVAILLTFFLGCLGGQFFYLGKYWQGAVCVLFCWTYIPGIWGIIQAIMFLSMSDEEFNYKYNQ